MNAPRIIAAAVATAVLFVSGLALAAGVTITLTPTGPQPPKTTVALGDTVTFVNSNPDTRELKSPDEGFGAATIPTGGSHEYVATIPGTFNYSYGTERTDRGSLIVQTAGSVTLAASSKSVTFGRPLRLTGRATPGGFPVVLEERVRGSDWKPLATVTPAVDGAYVHEVRPDIGVQYRALLFGGALRSSRVSVQVKPNIVLASSVQKARVGRTLNLRVRVIPADATSRVELSLYNPSRKSWRKISTNRLTNGRVVIPWKVVSGKSRLRASISRRNAKPGLESAESRLIVITGIGPSVS